jgi:hypothetical protein
MAEAAEKTEQLRAALADLAAARPLLTRALGVIAQVGDDRLLLQAKADRQGFLTSSEGGRLSLSGIAERVLDRAEALAVLAAPQLRRLTRPTERPDLTLGAKPRRKVPE